MRITGDVGMLLSRGEVTLRRPPLLLFIKETMKTTCITLLHTSFEGLSFLCLSACLFVAIKGVNVRFAH